MRIKELDNMAVLQRQYHRQNPWRLSPGGLYVPHCYKETKPDALSYWDDVGFVLNGRRIIVWWTHPRLHYSDALDDAVRAACPRPETSCSIFDGAIKNYKLIGKSGKRKKLVSYTTRTQSPEWRSYYDELQAMTLQMSATGIDFECRASWKWERLRWAMGVSLVAPLEVRSEKDLAGVADLARRLILQKTTLEDEFPGYRYGRNDWIAERAAHAAVPSVVQLSHAVA
jgi:hypothetical protein